MVIYRERAREGRRDKTEKQRENMARGGYRVRSWSDPRWAEKLLMEGVVPDEGFFVVF